MKKIWENAEIAELQIQATELTDTPVTGVDQEYYGEDGTFLGWKAGVAYNSGSAKDLTVYDHALDKAKELGLVD